MKIWHSLFKRASDQSDFSSNYSEACKIKAVTRLDPDNVVTVTITDIDFLGMCIEVPGADITVGMEMTLVFHCAVYGNKKLCTETVRVVSSDTNGIKVKFCSFDNQHQSNIQNLFYQLHHAA